MKSDYYICLVNRNGEEVANKGNLCPTWYGITLDMADGIACGLRHGDGRKTISAHIYELNGTTRGKLIREIL